MIYYSFILFSLTTIFFTITIVLIKKIQSQKKEVSSVLSDVLHGIQTPLTIMKGEIDLFSNTSDNTRLIESLNNAIDRLSNYVIQKTKKLS